MVRFLTFPFRLPHVLLRSLYRASRTQRDRGRRYAFYAFPAVLGLLGTFTVLRCIAYFWPQVNWHVNEVHVHHFTFGILVLIISGFLALATEQGHFRYVVAAVYGAGVGLVLDEFYVWLRLEDSVLAHSQYDAVVVGASLFLAAIIMPTALDGFSRYWNGDA